MSRAREHGRRWRPSPLQLLAATALLAGGALFARSSVEAAGSSAAIQRALEAPGDAGRENDLGNQLLLAGDADGAEAAYRRAIELAPDDATPRYNLGRLLLERGHRFSARRELARAIELDPAHGEARYFLGMAYDDLGLDRLARSHYRRAFELEPSLTDPRLHPEVARRRQALAAMLELWERNETSASGAAAPVAGSAPRPVASGEPVPVESVELPSEAGGGYARVTGGERTDRTDRSSGAGEGSVEISSESGTRVPSARRSARGSRDTVIDPTDLRTGVSVNQIVAPGESQRGGRSTTSRPSKSSRGFGSRFTPPDRPIEQPFDPDEESTGRIEHQLLAPDDAPYAIAG